MICFFTEHCAAPCRLQASSHTSFSLHIIPLFLLFLCLALYPLKLTATLRNLADHPDSRTLFVSLNVIPALCLVLHRYCEDKDVCTNTSRIFRYNVFIFVVVSWI